MSSERQTSSDVLYERLHVAAQARLRDGVLPREDALRTYAGRGSGLPCALCDARILAAQVEYEIEVASAKPLNPTPQVLRFHLMCYQVWDYERHAHFRSSNES